jgi:Reverse transcriptase (RNA-dependent DNA polymerase)
VIQGSVIAPILFLLLINDIYKNLNYVETLLYTDDTTIYKGSANINYTLSLLQKALDDVQKWSEAWGFKFSTTKSAVVFFTQGTGRIDNRLTLYGVPIPVIKEIKFLGVIFDSRLTFVPHINYTKQKCLRRLNILKVTAGKKWGANKSALLTIYKALIRPLSMYASNAIDSASTHTKKQLDIIQHKCLAIICGAARGTRSDALQVHTGELPLNLQRTENMAIYFVKTIKNPSSKKDVVAEHWTNFYGNFNVNKNTLHIVYCLFSN